MADYIHPHPESPGFPNIFAVISNEQRVLGLVHWLIHWTEIEYAADPIMHEGAKKFLAALLKIDETELPTIRAGGLHKAKINIPSTKNPQISLDFPKDIHAYIEFLPILEETQKKSNKQIRR